MTLISSFRKHKCRTSRYFGSGHWIATNGSGRPQVSRTTGGYYAADLILEGLAKLGENVYNYNEQYTQGGDFPDRDEVSRWDEPTSVNEIMQVPASPTLTPMFVE